MGRVKVFRLGKNGTLSFSNTNKGEVLQTFYTPEADGSNLDEALRTILDEDTVLIRY